MKYVFFDVGGEKVEHISLEASLATTKTQRDNNIFRGLFTTPMAITKQTIGISGTAKCNFARQLPCTAADSIIAGGIRNISIFTSGLLTIFTLQDSQITSLRVSC